MVLSLTAISIIVFYSIVGLLIYRNRHRIQSQYKVFLLFRTKRGVKTINSLARLQKFWRFIGYLSIPVGYLGMIAMLGLLVKSLIDSIFKANAPAGVSLVIPGVHVPGSEIFVPFWYGIISLVLLIIVHEGFHGIIAKSHNIKIKNTGLGLFLFLPLAFVEPDEKELLKRPAKVQSSVYASGSFANFLLAGLTFLIGIFLIFPAAGSVTQLDGVEVATVLADFPADSAGISTGDIITSINNVNIDELEVLSNEMNKLKPGDTVSLNAGDKDILVKTTSKPGNESQPYLGISFAPHTVVKPSLRSKYGVLPWALVIFSRFLVWLFFLNIGIGLFNMLPIGFVDGGRMAQVGIKRIIKNENLANKMFVYLSLSTLLLILLNLFSPLLF